MQLYGWMQGLKGVKVTGFDLWHGGIWFGASEGLPIPGFREDLFAERDGDCVDVAAWM